jgi:phenylpropionate dioxygenase-like ring-hydroxylating dioxygenase large terminal subunit
VPISEKVGISRAKLCELKIKGGVVVDNNIQCPFHAWQFDCSGTCTKIPYAGPNEAIPKGTSIK